MNRRRGCDASLNAPIRYDGRGREWQDCLVTTNSRRPNRLMAERRGVRSSPLRCCASWRDGRAQLRERRISRRGALPT